MPSITQLSEGFIADLRAMLAWWKAQVQPLLRGTAGGSPRTRVLIGKTKAGGIPARVGNTPGSAEVDLWDFDPETGDMVPRLDSEDAQIVVTVWNTFGSVVGSTAGTVVHFHEHVSGRLMVCAADCAASGS